MRLPVEKTDFISCEQLIEVFREYIKSDNVDLEISILREWFAQYNGLTTKECKNYRLMRQSGCTTALVRVCGFLTHYGYSVAMIVLRQVDISHIRPIVAHYSQPRFPIISVRSPNTLRGYSTDLIVTDNLDYSSPRDVEECMACIIPVAKVLLRFNTI